MPAKNEKGKAVVKKKGTTAMDKVPEYLQKAALEAGDISADDALLPLLKLLQSNSTEVQLEEPLGSAGEFIVTSTGENLGKRIFVIPVVQKKKRIKWVDFDDGGGIECISLDGNYGSYYGECMKCKFKEFGAKGKPPECMFYFDYMSLVFKASEVAIKKGETLVSIPDAVALSKERGAVVMSCYMTKLKAARKLNTHILRAGLKMYTGVFSIEPEFIQRDPYKWWTFKSIDWAGYVPAELFVKIEEDIAPVLAEMSVQDYQPEQPGEDTDDNGEF